MFKPFEKILNLNSSNKRDDISNPPKEMRDLIGSANLFWFNQIGYEFVKHFITLCGLKPEETVLDVGCGCGRMARPLSQYLEKGRYEGIDIVPSMINWCQKNITQRFPNFRFQTADIYNKHYNPLGKPVEEFKFPYEDKTFDFIFLTSVFTHMYPQNIEHYLAEIKRTLKPQGRIFSTFFMIPEGFDLNKSKIKLFKLNHFYTTSLEVPERVIAYNDSYVREALNRKGFLIVEPIYYGFWSTGETVDRLTYQDVVVAKLI